MTQDKRRALGRGLETLLPASQVVGGRDVGSREASGQGAPVAAAAATAPVAVAVKTADGELRELSLEEIERNPYQTRRQLKEETLNELAASIRANGVMQPIVVRPQKDGRYQLIAGERRWQASKRAGKTHIPALVRQVSDQQALEMTIIENIQRDDLGPLEQARAFDRLSREFALTQEQMAMRTGKERATVANYLRLLKLPFEVQMELENNFRLTFSHAKLLLMLDSEEQIKAVAKAIVKQNLSVLKTEEIVFNLRTPVEKLGEPKLHVDPNVREAEVTLERALGCRVRIKDRNGRGKIVIEYARLEDFDRVVEILGR